LTQGSGPRQKTTGVTHGNAILSRWPIVKEKSFNYPQMHQKEQRRAAIAPLIDTPHGKSWFVNTHLSHRPCSAEQRRQAVQLMDWLDTLEETAAFTVLCGDLNSASWMPCAGYSAMLKANQNYRDLWLEGGRGAPHRATCPSLAYSVGCGNQFLKCVAQRIDHIFLSC